MFLVISVATVGIWRLLWWLLHCRIDVGGIGRDRWLTVGVGGSSDAGVEHRLGLGLHFDGAAFEDAGLIGLVLFAVSADIDDEEDECSQEEEPIC